MTHPTNKDKKVVPFIFSTMQLKMSEVLTLKSATPESPLFLPFYQAQTHKRNIITHQKKYPVRISQNSLEPW